MYGSRYRPLYPVFDPEGRSVGLATENDEKVLCLFSRKVLAERWLFDMGLQGHIVGKGFVPEEVARFCDVAMMDGFRLATINPPTSLRRKIQMGTILKLKEQAIAKMQTEARI